MKYPVTIVEEKDSWFKVSFPDVPEAITHAKNYDEAVEAAKGCLPTALEIHYCANWRPLPKVAPLSFGFSVEIEGLELLKFKAYDVAMRNNYTLKQVLEIPGVYGKHNPFLSNSSNSIVEVYMTILKHFNFKVQVKVIDPIKEPKVKYTYFHNTKAIEKRGTDTNIFQYYGVFSTDVKITDDVSFDQHRFNIAATFKHDINETMTVVTNLTLLHSEEM